MAFTNSFHSSARGHSIKNAAKLSSCQRHNSRGYQAWDYSADKISALIGQPDNLGADVRAFIDDTFAEAKERYNQKQTRTDRLVTCSPFEHFNNNKKMDIATESILQVADKEFWDEFRTDETITRNGKDYVRHSFSPDVQKVMNTIFKKQLEAYERIYDTHKDEILEKVQNEQTLCKEFLSALDPEKAKGFELIRNSKAKVRDAAIEKMSLEEQEEYSSYVAATNTLNSIDEMQLIDRIRDGKMHIKAINGTGHYDEYSPHAHAVSVCWAEGFKAGFDSRIAKSIVLNRWSLEVIQARMHEIAQEEIDKHPEIFRGRKLDEIQEGRNVDYSKEYYLRRQIERLRHNSFLVSSALENTTQQMEEHFEDIVGQAVENVLNGGDVYDDALFLLNNCSDERFEELSQEGNELKKQLLPKTVDIDFMKDGFDKTLAQIKGVSKDVTWAERQAFFQKCRDISDEFWRVRADLNDIFKEEISNEYDKRRDAMQSFYDARYALLRSRGIFSALLCFVWAMVSLSRQRRIESKIEELKQERSELILTTATFKRYNNAYREQLKAGKNPTERYLTLMESIVREIDEEIQAQPRRDIYRVSRPKNNGERQF